MRCIGTTSRLKSLYGTGYNLEITFRQDIQASQFVESILPPGWKVSQSMLHNKKYTFTPTGDHLADIFQYLYQYSTHYGISSWGISQTTLDEIFASLLTEKDM